MSPASSGPPEAGAIDQVGTWTAPPRSGIFHITAQNVADPTKTAFATGTVSSAEVTISIEPDHVILTAGGPGFQFKAHVTGSPDTTVTWSIEEPPGGSSIDAAGVFKPRWERASIT